MIRIEFILIFYFDYGTVVEKLARSHHIRGRLEPKPADDRLHVDVIVEPVELFEVVLFADLVVYRLDQIDDQPRRLFQSIVLVRF